MFKADNFLVNSALAFLFVAIGSALFTSTGIFGLRLINMPITGLIFAIIFLFIIVFAFAFVVRRDPQVSDAKFILAVSLLGITVRAFIVFLNPSYQQTGDCLYLLDSVKHLAANGYGSSALMHLAGIYYDDYLWVGRSLPFWTPLAIIFPGNEIIVARVVNIALSLAHNLIVYLIAIKLGNKKHARLAFLIVSLIPVHAWMVLDYTHQYLGALFVIWSIYLIVSQITDQSPGWKMSSGRGFLLGVFLVVMTLQSGIDRFLIVVCLMAFVVMVFFCGWRARGIRYLAVTILIAGCVYAPFSRFYSGWLDEYRQARMSSHPVSFTARGWNLATMGEYYGVYEQIDRETPWPHKPEAMKSLILSQAVYEPVRTLFVLPVVKMAKYFLIGYATGIPEKLEADHPVSSLIFQTTRLVFAPVFLCACLMGLVAFAKSASSATPAMVLTILVPGIFAGIYLVAGETSPRYSFHIQGILSIIAGWGLARNLVPGEEAIQTLKRISLYSVAGLILLAATVIAIPALAKNHFESILFADMRNVVENGNRPTVHDDTLFTATIKPADVIIQSAGQRIVLKRPADRQSLSLFIWPLRSPGESADATVLIRIGEVSVKEMSYTLLRGVNRVAFPLPPSVVDGGEFELSVEVRQKEGSDASNGLPALRWGYVRFEP